MTEAIEILIRQREWYRSRGKTLHAHVTGRLIDKLRAAVREKAKAEIPAHMQEDSQAHFDRFIAGDR